VKLLLDTHAFLWLHAEPERFGSQLSILEDTRNDLVVSAASAWEIAIKHARGRLPLPEPPVRYVPDLLRRIGAESLAVEHSHALATSALPPLHGDLFDRLLVAQARLLDATLVTSDERIVQYPVRTLVI